MEGDNRPGRRRSWLSAVALVGGVALFVWLWRAAAADHPVLLVLLAALMVCGLALRRRAAELSAAKLDLEQAVTQHRRVEADLRLDEARLEALLRLGQMSAAPLAEITDYALEQGVALTRSAIGYLAFLNADESVLTMHSWSKSAMAECAIGNKPIVYPVVDTGLWGEAVRQRRPVITNDYLAPNPLKRGHPAGHVKVRRHMNLPVFDGPRMVAVAGVGNKDEPYDDSDVRQLTLLMAGMWRLLQRKRAEEALAEAHSALEARVAQRTAELSLANAELARSNRELEYFAYVASHDLQEPLRKITAFGELLRTEQSASLSAEGLAYLIRITDGATRMQELLEALLAYSRVSTRDQQLQTVVVAGAAQAAVDDLCLRLAESDGEVDIDAPHAVLADAARLRELLQNLIGNALKYRPPQRAPRITVTSRLDGGGQVAIEVRDNGIGFEQTYAERIFKPFQRLHGRDEYSGTGMGLAICERIVQRHGGAIRAEGQPGVGAVFTVTLPAADALASAGREE
jgi:signal transduction histidine kinase